MKPPHVRALFILKRREDYSTNIPFFNQKTVSTGMFNSSTFVSNMLNDNNIDSSVIIVNDNNDIDREVTKVKPSHVFIEGFWVVPEKFDILKRLHPAVTWIVRCHSELPFLGQEGIAFDWIINYLKRNVRVAGNSPRINRELRLFVSAALHLPPDQLAKLIPLLPNYYYPVDDWEHRYQPVPSSVFNVGCFGAIRPLKNHIVQAMAAIDFAEQYQLHLHFHVNTGRIELGGDNYIKNLRAIFASIDSHHLVEHQWTSHKNFLKIVREMDVCMQVSFTETFNIVTADAVNERVPVVVSKEIPWVYPPYADPTSTISIVETMATVLSHKDYYIKRNITGLKKYSFKSAQRWIRYLTQRPERNLVEELLLDIEKFFKWL